MEPQEMDEMLRTLLRITVQQDTINQDIRACIQEQREFNRQQVEINVDVKTTLVRIETLLARMLHTGENGQEA